MMGGVSHSQVSAVPTHTLSQSFDAKQWMFPRCCLDRMVVSQCTGDRRSVLFGHLLEGMKFSTALPGFPVGMAPGMGIVLGLELLRYSFFHVRVFNPLISPEAVVWFR